MLKHKPQFFFRIEGEMHFLLKGILISTSFAELFLPPLKSFHFSLAALKGAAVEHDFTWGPLVLRDLVTCNRRRIAVWESLSTRRREMLQCVAKKVQMSWGTNDGCMSIPSFSPYPTAGFNIPHHALITPK